jgi:hypothetical protein
LPAPLSRMEGAAVAEAGDIAAVAVEVPAKSAGS